MQCEDNCLVRLTVGGQHPSWVNVATRLGASVVTGQFAALELALAVGSCQSGAGGHTIFVPYHRCSLVPDLGSGLAALAALA